MSKTFLCITCEFKGLPFMAALHELGHKVFLVTSSKTKENIWPNEILEDIFYMDEKDGRKWNMDDLISGTAYLFREHNIDKIIALDDYDVWKASVLREEFRSPGMGQTTARHFYDKLAMRMVAQDSGINIPGFTSLFNDTIISDFFKTHSGPYVIKPRMDAGAIGIRKIKNATEYWEWNETNQDKRHRYLVEVFKPGSVYHVDSLVQDYKQIFVRASRYLQPPFEVAHGGGIFRSQTLDNSLKESQDLKELNGRVLKVFRLKFGASHGEYIRSDEDGKLYFLETSARVGGAHLADMVNSATGVNLWREWARIEHAELLGETYESPKDSNFNAGIIVTLIRYPEVDYNQFSDSTIDWRLNKSYHIGLVFKDKSMEVIEAKLEEFANKIHAEYHSSIPLKE